MGVAVGHFLDGWLMQEGLHTVGHVIPEHGDLGNLYNKGC